MKLSEILKDWPEKKTDTVQFIHMDSVEDTDIILKPERAHNTALTSCDREIDREALAKNIFDIELENPHLTYEQRAGKIAEYLISTMPTWLKPTERK